MSAVTIPKGYQIEICEHDGWKGDCYTMRGTHWDDDSTEEMGCLPLTGAHDTLSSFKVSRI